MMKLSEKSLSSFFENEPDIYKIADLRFDKGRASVKSTLKGRIESR